MISENGPAYSEFTSDVLVWRLMDLYTLQVSKLQYKKSGSTKVQPDVTKSIKLEVLSQLDNSYSGVTVLSASFLAFKSSLACIKINIHGLD